MNLDEVLDIGAFDVLRILANDPNFLRGTGDEEEEKKEEVDNHDDHHHDHDHEEGHVHDENCGHKKEEGM